MISWEDFVTRRNLNFEKFKEAQGIKSIDDLMQYCKEFNLMPPSEAKLSALFPVENSRETVKVEHKEEKQNKKNKGEKAQ